MDTNLSLNIGFKGQISANAVAVPMQEGYLKVGGYVAESETNGLKFGVVVSVSADAPDQFKKGKTSNDIVRGVCVWDDAIAQNAPAHPDTYLCGLPCAALNHGFMWLGNWKKDATGAIDPVIGAKVIFKKADGSIEFVAGSTSNAPTGYEFLDGASVRDVNAEHGAFIYLN